MTDYNHETSDYVVRYRLNNLKLKDIATLKLKPSQVREIEIGKPLPMLQDIKYRDFVVAQVNPPSLRQQGSIYIEKKGIVNEPTGYIRPDSPYWWLSWSIIEDGKPC
ncbi:hypothetical protein ACFL5H_03060 [Candidatus Latescibacterota bacterium]